MNTSSSSFKNPLSASIKASMESSRRPIDYDNLLSGYGKFSNNMRNEVNGLFSESHESQDIFSLQSTSRMFPSSESVPGVSSSYVLRDKSNKSIKNSQNHTRIAEERNILNHIL